MWRRFWRWLQKRLCFWKKEDDNVTLQSSGPISLANIAGEFGGSTPHSLSEYYGVASGVPASGAIDFADFYGKSASTNTMVAGYSAEMGTGYEPSTGYGSLTPTTWNGQTCSTLHDSVFWFPPCFEVIFHNNTLPQNFFTKVSATGVFSDSGGSTVTKTRLSASATLFQQVGPSSGWTWDNQHMGFINGNTYTIKFE